MRTIVEVLVDGKISLTAPAEIKPDGTIWVHSSSGLSPLINGFLLEQAGISKSTFVSQVKRRKFTDDVLACCMRLGENPGCRVVRDKSAVDRERAAEAERNITPAYRARRAVSLAYLAADCCDRSQDDVEFHRLRGQAHAAFDQWKKDFPEAWLSEQADDLRSQADHERHLAAGAMVYDADGWISPAEQEKRRDEFLANAARLEQTADEMEGLTNESD